MITPGYVGKMATYNRWMNEGIYTACDGVSDDDRKKDCGAFFGSIHATLNHLLWADQMWVHRFAGTPKPPAAAPADSVAQYESFEELKRQREAFDQTICDWADDVGADWLGENHDWYSGTLGRDMTNPNWVLVTHMFNHQTHHRGQLHCLLTQFGVKTPVTDLPMMP